MALGTLLLTSPCLAQGRKLSFEVAAATCADRSGRVYGATIAPDVVAEPSRVTTPAPGDATVRAASEWLRSQPACAPTPERPS